MCAQVIVLSQRRAAEGARLRGLRRLLLLAAADGLCGVVDGDVVAAGVGDVQASLALAIAAHAEAGAEGRRHAHRGQAAHEDARRTKAGESVVKVALL